jgi:hypothetical protein
MGRAGGRWRTLLAGAALAAVAAAIWPAAPASAAASSPPSVNGVRASNVTLSTSLLTGYVDPRGLSTNCYFEYGLTTAYGSQTTAFSAGSGTSEVMVSASLAGLAAGTAYHFRLVAISSAGTTAGPDHTFTTTSIPLSFQLVSPPGSMPANAPFTIQGTLSGSGSVGREVELQVNPYPYASGLTRFGAPALTDASGHFSFAGIRLLRSAHFRVATVGATRRATSAIVSVQVALRAVLRARRVRRGGRGRYYRLYGAVTPVDDGGRVHFQLLRANGSAVDVGSAWIRRGGASYSRFGAIVRIRRRGRYRAYVTAPDGANIAGYSETVRLG